jgi:hypothetical protein
MIFLWGASKEKYHKKKNHKKVVKDKKKGLLYDISLGRRAGFLSLKGV